MCKWCNELNEEKCLLFLRFLFVEEKCVFFYPPNRNVLNVEAYARIKLGLNVSKL